MSDIQHAEWEMDVFYGRIPEDARRITTEPEWPPVVEDDEHDPDEQMGEGDYEPDWEDIAERRAEARNPDPGWETW